MRQQEMFIIKLVVGCYLQTVLQFSFSLAHALALQPKPTNGMWIYNYAQLWTLITRYTQLQFGSNHPKTMETMIKPLPFTSINSPPTRSSRRLNALIRSLSIHNPNTHTHTYHFLIESASFALSPNSNGCYSCIHCVYRFCARQFNFT